ncbi:zinc finger protein 436-like [Copidosoma floridanum]|uniref:zinc finger protein 436-like n=1 Tax=Copidosoma floridanum TaxID=29053 RepID=UPI0006C9A1ED|nr:zinc finger protein 436-like [Copidosoma floridanum]
MRFPSPPPPPKKKTSPRAPMTNSQQLAAEPASEQPQEELVQLTELKPVEHSRINGPPLDDKDTDGLKALRSFARGYQPGKRQAWDVDDEFGRAGKRSDEFKETEEEEDYYNGVNGDFEYLNGGNEEVYVYKHHRKPDSPPREEAKVRRPRGRPPKKKKKKVMEVAEPKEENGSELRSKINDIIEANILAERETNNNNNNNNDDNNNDGDDDDAVEKDRSEAGDGPRRYGCELCSARFKGSGGLRNHLKVVHSAGPLFKCDECGKEFPLKERLKLHVRTHTGFKPYRCAECDKSFARGGQLVQHRRTHSQVKPYSCQLCSGTFTCAANLALHLKRHNNQKDHKCDICGRGFVRRDALKKHLECLHKDVKSFLCVICNKTFKGHLPQHMRTHARDRPHGCATCGQRFAQKSQLTVHQRTHSGQRPFRCLVCWQAFAHSTALKLHTRRHTGERPFKCAECNSGFTQLPHWKKHMKCIHGRTEPYSCRGCDSFFRIKSDLESHEKDCHRGKESPTTSTSSSSSDSSNGSASVFNDPLVVADPASASAIKRYRSMSIEKIRLLLAVLLKRISRQERLDELGFGKRLIDEVLVDSLLSAGKGAVKPSVLVPEFEALQTNLGVFLEWTVPREHWENFRKMKRTPEEVLEALTAT